MYGAAGAQQSTADRMSDWQAPETAQAALRGLCPRCGAQGLFKTGFRAAAVSFAPSCTRCELDFTAFNVGDGPAAFLIMIVGAIVSIGVVITHLKLALPLWAEAMIWLPITILLVFGLLRVAKAALLVLEYRNKAREGQRVE